MQKDLLHPQCMYGNIEETNGFEHVMTALGLHIYEKGKSIQNEKTGHYNHNHWTLYSITAMYLRRRRNKM